MNNNPTIPQHSIPAEVLDRIDNYINALIEEKLNVWPPLPYTCWTVDRVIFIAREAALAEYLHFIEPIESNVNDPETIDERTYRKLSEWYLKQLRECQEINRTYVEILSNIQKTYPSSHLGHTIKIALEKGASIQSSENPTSGQENAE